MDDQRPPLHLAGPDEPTATDGPLDWAMAHLNASDDVDRNLLDDTQNATLNALQGIGWALVASLMPAPRWATPCLHPTTKTMPVIEGSRVKNVTVCESCGVEVRR